MSNDLKNIRVAITSDSISHRNSLQKKIVESGIEIVLNDSLSQKFLNKLDTVECDVLLFDADALEDKHHDYLDELLIQTRIPVIICDVSALTINEPKAIAKWHNTLLNKIADITGRGEWENTISAPLFKKNDSTRSKPGDSALARNVWVLGASLGGPDAVKRFLIGLPGDLPVSFILAQHLGENFVSLLAEQLDRYTELNVNVPISGHVIKHGEILVIPTDKQLFINPIGAVEYRKNPEKTLYTPSINTTIDDISRRYGERAGAIIFSGMCDDGVTGCENLAKKGGRIWIQDPKSCVISAMPDSVAEKVAVDYSGTPEQLAKEIVSLYM